MKVPPTGGFRPAAVGFTKGVRIGAGSFQNWDPARVDGRLDYSKMIEQLEISEYSNFLL